LSDVFTKTLPASAVNLFSVHTLLAGGEEYQQPAGVRQSFGQLLFVLHDGASFSSSHRVAVPRQHLARRISPRRTLPAWGRLERCDELRCHFHHARHPMVGECPASDRKSKDDRRLRFQSRTSIHLRIRSGVVANKRDDQVRRRLSSWRRAGKSRRKRRT
jgi:hypothetical protein